MERCLRSGSGRKALACCAAALLGALGAIDGYGKTSLDGPVDAYFGDVRKRLLDMTPEARELLARLAEQGREYRPISGRTHLFVRTQLKYGLQRTDFLHNWYERPLYQDCTYAAASVKGRYLNELSWRRQVEVGKLSKADVAQLTAQRATDEYNIVQARANITKYITELQHLMTYDEEGPFELAIPTTTDEQALADIPVLQTVYEQAVAQRPEIKGSELGVKSSELGVKMARAGYSPTLSLTGGVGTSTNSLSDNTWGKQMKTNFDASAGLSLSIPLFDQRQTKTAIRKAKLQQLQAQLELDYQKDELYETVKGYWIDAETNQQRLRAAIVSEECEQQSFDLLQEQFNLGLKNIVELLQGKDKLLTAQQNRLESKYQTLLAMKMLKFYATPSRPPLKGRRV